MGKTDYFCKLKKAVIDAGICMHCGTCVGLFPRKLKSEETIRGPVPILKDKKDKITDELVYNACPATSINYQKLNQHVFGKSIKDYILGNYTKGYVGYSTDEKIRRVGASGGVITATLVYLLEQKLIEGAIVLKQGEPKPWLARPIIATTKEGIISCAQSVYVPVMVNKILSQLRKFKGNLAFVGLPDQVAAIRYLQSIGHKDALKIKYILGPYVGTAIYSEAIASYLRSNGAKGLEDIKRLKYREGEWPGYLRIDTKDGRTFKASKFYYNYLIPFYITTGSLITVDFTNELTDISVGDAWHPKYEKIGKGFSVVLGRTKQGMQILQKMKKQKLLHLEPKTQDTLVNMHGHMIDFKKRGAFIRMKFMRLFGRSTPIYDYRPKQIPFSRYIVELIISGIFFFGRMKPFRKVIETMPLKIVGPIFNFLRKSWKKLSKSTKRRGIKNVEFEGLE